MIIFLIFLGNQMWLLDFGNYCIFFIIKYLSENIKESPPQNWIEIVLIKLKNYEFKIIKSNNLNY